MRIALAATGPLGATLLRVLLDSDHEVVALLQNGRKATAFTRVILPRLAAGLAPRASLLGMARNAKIPTLYIDTMGEDELAPLRSLEPELLLVGGFSIILKKPLLELPSIGCVNCHSSLLPTHRGPNPFAAAILAGDAETGVTFHVMTEGIDSGDILLQRAFPIEDTDTGGAVYRKACIAAAEALPELLDTIERDGLKGTPQDEAQATYDKKLRKEELFLDWSKPAQELDRLVRACVPFRLARFNHRGRVVFVSRTSWDDGPADAPPGTIVHAGYPARIATGRGHLTIKKARSLELLGWKWPGLRKKPSAGEKLE